MSKVGYARVSSQDQSNFRQEDMLNQAGVEKLFMEKASGKDREHRPIFKEMMDWLRADDILIVESLSRLGRNSRDVLNIVAELEEKKVTLISLKENVDTNTIQGRFLLGVFASIAQMDRESILQRQMEGLVASRARGIKNGRKLLPFPKNWQSIYEEWTSGAITTSKAVEMSGLKRSTFYIVVKRWEAKVA